MNIKPKYKFLTVLVSPDETAPLLFIWNIETGVQNIFVDGRKMNFAYNPAALEVTGEMYENFDQVRVLDNGKEIATGWVDTNAYSETKFQTSNELKEINVIASKPKNGLGILFGLGLLALVYHKQK